MRISNHHARQRLCTETELQFEIWVVKLRMSPDKTHAEPPHDGRLAWRLQSMLTLGTHSEAALQPCQLSESGSPVLSDPRCNVQHSAAFPSRSCMHSMQSDTP